MSDVGTRLGGFPVVAAALAVSAWAALLLWDASPYGRYLHHDGWAGLALPVSLCAAWPAGAWAVPALLYGGGWVLMTAAMMLPTTLPLVRVFDRMVSGRRDRAALHALLIGGYLLAWAGFGVAAHGLDRAVHAMLDEWPWLSWHAWILGATVLALAGAFQFSAVKYHCLDRCRTPVGFVMQHWRGGHARRNALRLGVAHGAYCVGCCWALMLLMFVVGMGNVGWMFGLAIAMAVEKNHRWGRRLAAPLGVVLVAASLAVVADGVFRSGI